MGRLTTPRSIDPKDIRVGDRISMQGSDGNTEYAYTFTVADIRDGLLVDANGQRYSPANGYVQIVDRPEPPRKVGSRWRDPETGAQYIKTDHPEYLRYRAGHVGADSRLDENCTDDREIIARLVPVDEP